MIKLTNKMKKIISRTFASTLAVGAITGTALVINKSIHSTKYKEYGGAAIRKLGSLTETNVNFTVKSADIDFGNNIKITIDKDVLTEKLKDSAQLDKYLKELQAKFIAKRKETGRNATLNLQTNILLVTNNYLDIFDIADTVNFLIWFAKDVSWGPEIRSLERFSIVRGVNKIGKSFILGGNEGTRERDRIQFYPDSFFGMQRVYDPWSSEDGILTDTSDSLLFSNKGIQKSFAKQFIDTKLIPNWDHIVTDPTYDWENDKELEKSVFNIKVIEDYIDTFSRGTIVSFNSSNLISGSREYASAHLAEGNFENIFDFLNYISSKETVPNVDTILKPNGDKYKVFPKRYMRRLLLSIYANNISSGKNPLSEKDKIRRNNGGDKVGSKPEDISTDFIIENKIGEATSSKQALIDVSLYGFSSILTQDNAVRLSKLVYQWTGIKPFKESQSNVKDSEGNNLVSILYEKKYGVIESMKRYKEEYGWAPVPIDKDGYISVNSYIPNTYLWTDEVLMKSKGLFDLNSKLDHNDPELKKMDEALKRPVRKIGMEWIKYIANHEYGHHQTLTYAEDLSNSFDPTGTDGVYDLKRQSIAIANPFQHSYNDVYSRDFLNDWLASRSGGGNLDPSKFNDYTVQYSGSSSKYESSYVFLDKNGQVVNPQIDGKDAPDLRLSQYEDFANSWRGFKTIYELADNLPVGVQAMVDALHQRNEPSTILGAAYTLNALDEGSYSINPTVYAMGSGFGSNTSTSVVDPYGIPTMWNEYVKRHYVILDGWDFRSKGESLHIEQHFVRVVNSHSSTSKWTLPRLKLDGGIATQKDGTPYQDAPTFSAMGFSGLLFGLYDVTHNQSHDGSVNWKSNTKNPLFKAPDSSDLFGTANPLLYELLYAPIKPSTDFYYDPDTGENKINYSQGMQSGDMRYATTWIMKLPYKTVNGERVYISPKSPDAAGASMTVEGVSSGAFSSFMGRIVQQPLWTSLKGEIIDIYNDEVDQRNDLLPPGSAKEPKTSDIKEIAVKWGMAKFEEVFWKQLIDGLNQKEDRKYAIHESLPQAQVSGTSTKENYMEWFKSLFGLIGGDKSSNADFLSGYGEKLFKSYISNYGRFMPYVSDDEDSANTGYRPNTLDIVNTARGLSSSEELNKVYSTYLSTGAYSFVQSTMSDYQATVAEQITRDLAQLTYVPSNTPLQDDALDGKVGTGSTEHAFGSSASMPPIIVPLWQPNGHATVLYKTGEVDIKNRKIITRSTLSGFWEDYAVRSTLDTGIYRPKPQNNEAPYTPIPGKGQAPKHDDDYKLYDEAGNVIAGNIFDKPLTGSGHYISQTGKSYVNMLQRTYGIEDDKDISAINFNKDTGWGQMHGYIPEDVKAAGYNKIAFVDESGAARYIDINFGYSNQFFNLELGRADTKLSMLEYYFNEKGQLVKRDHAQVSWSSDEFLASGYNNTFFDADTSYKMYFTKGKTLEGKRNVNLGSIYRPEEKPDGHYEMVEKELHWVMNNRGDIYMGIIQVHRRDTHSATEFMVKG